MEFNRAGFLEKAIQTESFDDVSEMRKLVLETLNQEGHDPEIDDEGNVLVTRGSVDPDQFHLVLNTHIDTVPPYISYERHGDIVKGRGACDAKGPLASLLEAFCSASINEGKLTLAITPDEETSQVGGFHLGKTLTADGYIVGEPTGLDVCIAARGNFGGQVTIYGESAHASDPDDGVNPLRAAGAVVKALEQYDEQHGPGEHELLGSPTLTATRIEGGGPLNQIPSECTISFDRRTVPPEAFDEFLGNLESYLDHWIPDEYQFQVSAAYPDSPAPEAFATDMDAELVKTLAKNSGGTIRPFEAATEASYFANDGPTVVFGPGHLADGDGPVAHSDREYVALSAVEQAANAVQQTVESLL